MDLESVVACADEFAKIAAKIRVWHGTRGMFKTLRSRLSHEAPNFPRDPNPRGLYMAIKTRVTKPGVETFARKAVEVGGGEPVLAHAKIDTKKGWRPRGVTPAGRKAGVTIDDLEDAIRTVDSKSAPAHERAGAWRMLNEYTGSWWNPSATEATVRPSKYSKVITGRVEGRPRRGLPAPGHQPGAAPPP